jgi:hypothetical protein
MAAKLDSECFPAELIRLRQTALALLTAHIRDGQGACVVCGVYWPCELARRAAWTLEVA